MNIFIIITWLFIISTSEALRLMNPCYLPKETGPCRGSFRRYYFNRSTKKCERFIYGGCQGNANNYRSLQECQSKCVKEENPCKLPKVSGMCKAYFPRYFYNSKSGKCEKFIYGGCGGNANNFVTLEDCEAKCVKVTNPCHQPKKPGPCRGSMTRYYYNKYTRKCEQFTYGGCQGNQNNFVTNGDCESKCMKNVDPCIQQRYTGPCRGYLKRFYYNKKTNKCEQFIYGGCRGTANNFKTIEQCQSKCVRNDNPCDEPKQTGRCRAAFKRFYYNKKSGKCEMFIYGGCGGNRNNFNTLEDCQGKCVKKDDTCSQPKQPGMCRAYFRRYYYNSASQKCELFIYGGCGANKNNFNTIEECEAKCVQKNRCDEPKDPGPCRGNMIRYYYNSKSERCEKFYYGGCKGNGNNFRTFRNCENTCVEESCQCTLEKDAGKCRGYGRKRGFPKIRYYFNYEAGRCMKFHFYGCGGNKNRFTHLEQCEKKCEY